MVKWNVPVTADTIAPSMLITARLPSAPEKSTPTRIKKRGSVPRNEITASVLTAVPYVRQSLLRNIASRITSAAAAVEKILSLMPVPGAANQHFWQLRQTE